MDYKRKLNQSYKVCIRELMNPTKDWEKKVNYTKYTIDPILRKPKSSHTFVLDFKEYIDIDSNHSYKFKRSHFYKRFREQSNSRLKQDLIEYYKQKGYLIDLYRENGVWNLKLSWVNNRLENL